MLCIALCTFLGHPVAQHCAGILGEAVQLFEDLFRATSVSAHMRASGLAMGMVSLSLMNFDLFILLCESQVKTSYLPNQIITFQYSENRDIYSRIALWHSYTHAKLYCPGVTGFAKLERWGSLIAKDTALPEAVVKKLGIPLPQKIMTVRATKTSTKHHIVLYIFC